MQGLLVFTLAALVACVYGSVPYNFWSSKVVGGTNAGDGEFPYMVSLRTSTNSHFCGGSIASANYIVTAAHCVVGKQPGSVKVVSGTNKLNSGGTVYSVSNIIVHENYIASDSWRNDIALLKVSTPITFNAVTKAITLPSQGEPANDGLAVTATGWGYTTYPPSGLPNDLQKVSLAVVGNDKCQQSHTGTIYITSVCAGGDEGKGVCNGDSGGPLTNNDKLIGIVSWGRPCAIGAPDVYTRVPEYRSWIDQNAV